MCCEGIERRERREWGWRRGRRRQGKLETSEFKKMASRWLQEKDFKLREFKTSDLETRDTMLYD
jgi:hypothetical protein